MRGWDSSGEHCGGAWLLFHEGGVWVSVGLGPPIEGAQHGRTDIVRPILLFSWPLKEKEVPHKLFGFFPFPPFLLIYFLFWDTVSLCNTSWPGPHHVDYPTLALISQWSACPCLPRGAGFKGKCQHITPLPFLKRKKKVSICSSNRHWTCCVTQAGPKLTLSLYLYCWDYNCLPLYWIVPAFWWFSFFLFCFFFNVCLRGGQKSMLGVSSGTCHFT